MDASQGGVFSHWAWHIAECWRWPLGSVHRQRLLASVPQATPHTRAQERDQAFESFFLQHDRQVTGYLWRMLGDEQSARELAQETFLRAWQHFDAIRHYERPLAWLFRVATNLALQHRRHRATTAVVMVPLPSISDPAGSDPTGHLAEQDAVQSVLLRLPLNQRAALLLREVYGFSCAEIGEFVQTSRGGVSMLLLRARDQFRRLYLQENEIQP